MNFNWPYLLSLLVVIMLGVVLSGSSGKEDDKDPQALHPALHDSLERSTPRFNERREERHRMVEEALLNQGITDPATVEAMRNVPRHLFMPARFSDMAYRNRPMPIGHQQTISQPTIVGKMTELLELESDDKVLEIGTGSGYQAAVLSEITPNVYTIEIVEPLAKQVRKRFEKLGYHTIKTKIGDGYKGWEKHAPFDGIIITAAAPEIPQPLIDQLKPGGILVMPIGETDGIQFLTRIHKKQNGELEKERISAVRFVPMTGDIQDE